MIPLNLFSTQMKGKIGLSFISNFDYIEKKGSDKQYVVSSHTLTNYPKELQKKIVLLQHFRNYLKDKSKVDSKSKQKDQPVYIKKWIRTKHAIMFRLSNKLVQVIFEDKTEIILSSELKEVVYVNKKEEKEVYSLATALDADNRGMTKRLKYTKDILAHMLAGTDLNKQSEIGNELTARSTFKENI